MDVRCESCNSEYEFDEARIPAAGLPVKCSTCSHVFRVYPPGEALPSSTGGGAEWMVRQVNGSVFSFRELTTLQRWIVERKVARDDEISKTGKQWKRLGDIAELSTFFQVVEAAPVAPQPQAVPQQQQSLGPLLQNAAQQLQQPQGTGPQQQMPQGTGPQQQMPMPQGTGPQQQMPMPQGTGPQQQMPMPQGTGPQQQMPMPQGTGPQQQMPMPQGTGPQQQMPMPQGTGPQQQMPMPQGTGPQQQMPMPQGTGPQQQMPMPGTEAAAWEGDQQLGFNPPSGNWRMHETNPGFSDSTFDDDDDFELKRGGAGKWVVLLLVVLIGGGAAAVYFLRPDLVQQFVGGKAIDAKVVAQVKAGYQKLARDSYTAIDEATSTFEKAMAAAPDYPDAKAGLAEAELARADYLKEEADELAATLGSLEPKAREVLEVQIENKRREASQRSKRAFEAAKKALTEAPKNVAANRAMADYFRVMNAMDKMQPRVDAARKISPKDARLELVVGASLAKEARDAAINHLEAALAADPELQRARYELASIHVATKKPDKAAVHVERLLQEVPDHERAQALKARLTPEPEPEPEPEPSPDKPKVGFEGLMKQGERLRDADRPGQALKAFERASDMMPDEPDVYLGMGWCYIDLDKPAAAISTFKTALRYAPRLSDAHMGLAEGYRMKGDKANAVKHYEKYLDIMSTGPEADVARRMLKQLKK